MRPNQFIKITLPLILLLILATFLHLSAQPEPGKSEKDGLAKTNTTDKQPLKALLIAGGCCHDYEQQHKILYEGIQQRANMRVDVVWTNDKSHDPPFHLFKKPDWAKGYDVIIHDECAALKKDETELQNILNAHKTVPAVHLHCAMHSFRLSYTGNQKIREVDANWAKHLGIRSNKHGPHEPISVKITNPDHPIMKGMKSWVTEKEELYNNLEIFDIDALALGTQTYKRGGEQHSDSAVVIWTNTKYDAPSFSTTLGHFNHTVADPKYLELITRGALWACGKLDDPDYRAPYTGSNLVEEIPAKPDPKKKAAKTVASTSKPPANALLTKVTAKSTQKDRDAWYAIDGDTKTRWCGDGPDMPCWIQLELPKPTVISSAEIEWEIRGHWMRYKIETSNDAKTWQLAFDASANEQSGIRRDRFTTNQEHNVKFVRLTALRQQDGMWPSLFEFRLYGKDGKLLPIIPKVNGVAKIKPEPKPDPYKSFGNIPPRPHRLSPEAEAELLKDVAVPAGFKASLFAPWQMANYPTCVAAAPNGDLYVSSDGNASGGRQAGRGRVLRLRDTDKDGRADQVTEFVRDVDSPRGLVWDHDRLYLLHPPHITAYHDPDGDGVADKSERLISDIAFGFKDRSADHTTNGLEMGIDGWIYIAVGDFGFMKATGTDGRTLQMRGGGVVRFRPDGSGLETFSDGARNIYGLPISPTLDIFARDNTNDGGGWDVRFHHFTGLEDHGYPRLYMNFKDEIIAPVNDYGGGSGCGAFYIDEPGIPAAWNNKPYTVDWGRVGSFRHDVKPKGATFEEPSAPQQFIKMTRPTDADVDGMSAVYQSSWKGPAQFTWGGVEHGYIARVAPAGFQPEPLPDFAKLSDSDLVNIIRTSPSHVRRLNAQRMLLRRPASATTENELLAIASDPEIGLSNRVAALYGVTQRGIHSSMSEAISARVSDIVKADDPLLPFVIRAFGDMGQSQHFKTHLSSDRPRVILESIIAAVRKNKVDMADEIAKHLSSDDPVIAHTAYRGLARLGAYQAALPYLDSEDDSTRNAASWALMRMHSSEAVDTLISELSNSKKPEKRRALISILSRLHHRESTWKGDSWSTRPDTRGPYYELDTWEKSSAILTTLNETLKNPDTPVEETKWIVSEMGKNRIQNDASLERILTLAESDESLIPTLVNQLSKKSDYPARAIPLVIKAAKSEKSTPGTLKEAVEVLLEAGKPEAFVGAFSALSRLKNHPKASAEREVARKLYLASPQLENHQETLIQTFHEKPSQTEGHWAAQGILKLANDSKSPETREATIQAINKGWQTRAGKISLMDAAFWVRVPILNDRIRILLDDSDNGLKQRAASTARRLGIQRAGADTTVKIATLKPEDAVKQVSDYTKGDIALGEAVFTRATCGVCHTVNASETPKGPYLGSIAEIYRRPELTEAILIPGKTIAQGFKTNLFTLNDGQSRMGFVTNEKGESVTVRDIAGNESTFKKSEISKRDTLPNSLMPPALMNGFSIHETASLLDYLEALSKKN